MKFEVVQSNKVEEFTNSLETRTGQLIGDGHKINDVKYTTSLYDDGIVYSALISYSKK